MFSPINLKLSVVNSVEKLGGFPLGKNILVSFHMNIFKEIHDLFALISTLVDHER
jgi:hypothetical protein